MLFNSLEFIFAFLPIVFIIYYFLNYKRLIIASKTWLVGCSLFFYGWWNLSYLPLLLISLFINYFIGSSLGKEYPNLRKKRILIFGIIINVGFLGYFKYTDFFITNINYVFGSNLSLLNLALPLAISFFTFEQIIYLVDSYRGETREYSFLDYSLFVTFFPKLIAGPIVYHNEIIPQFKSLKKKIINWKNISRGIFIFYIGLFKKIVIADNFAIWATQGFSQTGSLSFLDAWITSLSYTFQLYFDFSGYCDMAIGIALLFNIKLLINFNSPYKATDIQDFWRRWHITLGRFLTQYIYIPLGGNRKGSIRTYINILIIFFISGFWHGAGWTFILWGCLHGIAMCINRFWKQYGFKLNRLLAWFITFNFVNITWVFFRANDISGAIRIIKGMLGLNGATWFDFSQYYFWEGFNLTNIVEASIWVILFLFVTVLCKNSNQMLVDFKPKWNIVLFLSFNIAFTVLTLISVYFGGSKSEFLYFNF